MGKLHELSAFNLLHWLLNLLLRSFRDADNPYFCCCCCFSSFHATFLACARYKRSSQACTIPRTRHDYSNKNSHVNVRKMLWDQPTKRWKNPSPSKFPHPSADFSQKKLKNQKIKKKNPKQELSSYLESKRAARYSQWDIVRWSTQHCHRYPGKKDQEKKTGRCLKLHDGLMTSFMTIWVGCCEQKRGPVFQV